MAPERVAIVDTAAEMRRLEESVASAMRELQSLRQEAAEKIGESEAEIMDGHIMLLQDPELLDGVRENIESQQVNAEYALYEVSQVYIEALKGMDDEQMQARAVDLADVTIASFAICKERAVRSLPSHSLTASSSRMI